MLKCLRCIKSSSGATVLNVQVAGDVHECPTAGGQITVDAPAGYAQYNVYLMHSDLLLRSITITCPPVRVFCAEHLQKSNETVPWTFNPNDNMVHYSLLW